MSTETPVWDFEEFSITYNQMILKSRDTNEAHLLFRIRDHSLQVGIRFGDKTKWFPLTEDASDCLADFLEGRPIGTGPDALIDTAVYNDWD